MTIILLDSTGLVTQQLEQKLRARLPGVQLEVHSSFPSVYQRLSMVQEASAIAIMVADSRDLLQEFIKLRTLFIEARIVLVLPDHDQETVSLGHQLHPRYIGYMDGNFDDLAAVAARMVEKSRPFTDA